MAHKLTSQRIAITTIVGCNKDIRLQRFEEALKDPKSGLTYSSFVGARKQSVIDAERLFSRSLCEWFQSRGYN